MQISVSMCREWSAYEVISAREIGLFMEQQVVRGEGPLSARSGRSMLWFHVVTRGLRGWHVP